MAPKRASRIAEWVRNHQALATMAVLGAFILAVVLTWPQPGQDAPRLEVVMGKAAGGLLADVRGEDVLQRLQADQAAMRQEMAWVRQVLASREGVPSAETDLLRAVSEVQAEHAELNGFVRLLQVSQMRLNGIVIGCDIRLEALRERLEGLDLTYERN